jgi:release factor glutamine methyltransferase
LTALKASASNPVNLKQAHSLARRRLAKLNDIDNPAFEAEVLLRHLLNLDRVQLHLSFERQLTPEEDSKFFAWVERRFNGEPTAYILQNREFYGLDFYVDPRVLIPRPESELLVEEALNFFKTHPVASLADIGTGSGALAVSLAVSLFPPSLRVPQSPEATALSPSRETPNSPLLTPNSSPSLRAPQSPEAISPSLRIYAVDISPQVLEVAKINAARHNMESHITFLQGDLLEALPQPVDVIIANLPYVTTADVAAMPSAKFEPQGALDGGADGLDVIRRLAQQLKGKINPGGLVLLEIGLGQAQAISDYLRDLFPWANIEVLPDLAGIERVVKVNL